MRRWMLAIALTVLAGCQQVQVRKHSATLSGEVPELYYQQVLDNVAMAIAAPDHLPYFGLPAQGTSTNSRSVSAGFTPTWSFITPAGYFFSRWLLASQSAPLSGSNQNQTAFQLTPITDPDRLELLRLIFHAAANNVTPKEKMALQEYYKKHSRLYYDYSQGVFEIKGWDSELVCVTKADPAKPCDTPVPKVVSKQVPIYDLKPFWLSVETDKHHVPKDACYVGHYCDTYVWVDAGRSKDLRDLTMAALDIASIDLNTLKLHAVSSKSVSEVRETVNARTGAVERQQVTKQVLEVDDTSEERQPRQSMPWPYPAPPIAAPIAP